MRKIILLMAISIMASCVTHKRAKELYGCKEVQTTESSDTTETVREVPVFFEGDSAELFIPDTLDWKKVWGESITHKNKTASVTATKTSTGVIVKANCDSLEKVILAKDKVIRSHRDSIVRMQAEKRSWLQRKTDSYLEFIKDLLALIGAASVVWFVIKRFR